MARVEKIAKNAFHSTVANIISTIIGFFTRYVFVAIMGETFLGLNGLFSDILAILSFAELGIGSAITAYMYKPLATNDLKTINGLLYYYKKSYQYIILIIAIISISVAPFLRVISNGSQDISDTQLYTYYLLFTLTNIFSYYNVYKDSYLSAIQEGYRLQIINTAFNILTASLQIFVVVVFESYTAYLFVMTMSIILKRVVISFYISKLQPITKKIVKSKLGEEVKQPLFKNIKALIFMKLSSLLVSSTDSIIVSSIINIQSWGLVTNYNLLKTTIQTLAASFLSVVIPSLGNVVSTESEEKQQEIFLVYNTFAMWIYGICFVALAVLSSPFIQLLFGVEYVLNSATVFIIYFSFFLFGISDSVGSLCAATGLYHKVKWLNIVQAVINLVFSLTLINVLGLFGVFLATCLSQIGVIIIKPIIIYKELYQKFPKEYFKYTLKYMMVFGVIYLILDKISEWIIGGGITIISFIILGVIVAIFTNLLFILLNFKDEKVFECVSVIKRILIRKERNE